MNKALLKCAEIGKAGQTDMNNNWQKIWGRRSANLDDVIGNNDFIEIFSELKRGFGHLCG